MDSSKKKAITDQPAMLAGMLEQAFQQIGVSMMSNDFAAKLLAYVYIMGGGNEAVVYHQGLNAGIQIAQHKANLYGGEIPNEVMVILIQARVKELEKDREKCTWLEDIYTRYDLKHR